MVIGIIGAGLAGLIAGRELSRAGFDVTIIEKSRGYGGRLSTRYENNQPDIKYDHGVSWFDATSPLFKQFVVELMEQNLLMRWGDNIRYDDGSHSLTEDPNQRSQPVFTAKGGMNQIGKYLSRWVDVKTETLAGGLTYFGANRTRKKAWMINLTASGVFEADAVIVATPAPQAYGLLQTSTDETDTLKIIREIDEIRYESCYSLMAHYKDHKPPEWDAIIMHGDGLKTITNENSKHRNGENDSTFVIQTTHQFATYLHSLKDKEQASRLILQKFSEVAGTYATQPDWSQLHYWKYSRAMKTLDSRFMQLGDQEAPLAVIGDYFTGNSVEDSFLSGYSLAQQWKEKFL